MPQALRILITNNTLANRGGSEVYTRDLTLALMKRGHFPVAYSTVLGEVAEELRHATIPVISNLDDLNISPDIIHGQHHLETMTAALYFNNVPAIYTCHGWAPWEETPPVFPAIKKYVAVDDLCREKLYTTPGIRPEQIEVLYNFVDLLRFSKQRELPEVPKTALVFSNYISEGEQLDTIRKACATAGIAQVDVAGLRSGNTLNKPEDILYTYDVVFAKARSALEALACGCAVIVADRSGLGGMVTTDNIHRLRRLNFGVRTMQENNISEDNVTHELNKYNPEDSALVSKWVRENCTLENTTDHWLSIYDSVLEDTDDMNQPDNSADNRYLASYLRFLSARIKSAQHISDEKKLIEEDLGRHKKLLTDMQTKCSSLTSELNEIRRSKAWNLISYYRKIRSRMR